MSAAPERSDGSRKGGALRAASRAIIWIGVGAAAAAAAAHVGLLLYIFGSRLTYPLDIEWMESGMLCHALRVIEGKPIYAAPSADFISYLYTPFYAYVVGALGKLFGVSYLLGRLVSVLSLVVASALAFRAVQRQAGESRLAGALWGTATVGLIASSFPHTGAWYDLVRNDSLYLALVMGALYLLLYHHQRPWRVVWAGVLLGLAFLTKQTASIFILYAGAAALLIDWRRLLILVPTTGAVAGGAVLLLNLTTGGWFWRYVFEMHQGHDLYWVRIWPDTEIALFKAFPAVAVLIGIWALVALVKPIAKRRLPDRFERRTIFWFVTALVGVAVAAIGFATQWAETNAYIPALFFGALFAGVAGADLVRVAGGRERPLVAGLVAIVVGGAIAAQLVQQLYSPRRHVPDERVRAAGEGLIARLRSIEGPVLIPYHPFYPHLVGKETSYHQMGTNDVTRAGYPYPSEIIDRVKRQRYAAIVLDTSPLHGRYQFALQRYKVGALLQAHESPPVLTGYRVRPRWLLQPKRRTPAAAGVKRIFDFESGSYEGWQVVGHAFGSRPAGGEASNQALAGPYEGAYLASSFVSGDRQTGALLSRAFEVDKPALSYRIGGGRDLKRLFLRLLVEGKGEVHRATGRNSQLMELRRVDVSQYRGQKMRVELVDRATSGWGHLLFDELALEPVKAR